jgi:hypothetical protein
LTLDLDVIAFFQRAGEGGLASEDNGAMPFRSLSPFAAFAILPGTPGRQREGCEARVVPGRSGVGITAEESG